MSSFEVIGGKKLKGEIIPQGAKNEALQIISAVLLTPEKVTVSNIPDILDVNLLIELLGEMNVKIDRIAKDICSFQADDVDIDYLHSETYRKKSGRLRGSVMVAGPMLARFRKAFMPKPGGDKIGRRRLDTHIIGFEKLGVVFDYNTEDNFFHLEAREIARSKIYFWMNPPLQAPPILLWRHQWQKEQQQFIMLHANHTFSNYAKCLTAWAQKSAASAVIY